MKIVDLSPVLFREYDLRGIVGDIIDEDVAYTLGLGYGSYVIEKGIHMVVVGHDNRVSSPSLSKALIRGILETGCNVVDLGLVTTPMFYFARYSLKLYAGVMITASHNSKEYNGFKISFDEIGNAYGEHIQDFYRFCCKKDFKKGQGCVTDYDIKESYLEYFVNSINLKNKDIKVVVDCGNGTGSIIIEDILKRLGITYYLLYCKSDGNFPNHSADPSVENNMKDLKSKVIELGYDLGIGIDGDADRVAIVSERGQYLQADLYLLFMSRYLKDSLNEKKVLFDVKCSRALTSGLAKEGINGVMYRTGNSYLNKKMKEDNFSFGGEYSGHIFYRDKFAGFDDGIYAGMRFVEMIVNTGKKVSELLKDVEKYYSLYSEIKAGEYRKKIIVEKVKEYAKNKKYSIIDLDGVRIEFDYGWGLIRYSNTGPNLVVRYESNTTEGLEKIKEELSTLVDNLLIEIKE